jgi:hypothetical protein
VTAAIAAIIAVSGTITGIIYLSDRSGGTPNAGATQTRQPFQRTDPPGWLPPGWSSVLDDRARPAVVDGPATNGGQCTYAQAGVLHVTRTAFDVSGCVSAQYLKDLVLGDSAVEAQFAVAKGCGGMWLRTGKAGYFVAVCQDGRVELHRLGDDPPSDATRIGGPWHAADPTNVVVGFMAQGFGPVELTVSVDGDKQTVQDAGALGTPLRTGRVGVGGFAPHPVDAVDAIVTRFRAWTPTGPGPPG